MIGHGSKLDRKGLQEVRIGRGSVLAPMSRVAAAARRSRSRNWVMKLTEVGVNHNDLPKMAEDAVKNERLMKNNPRLVTYDDALALYEEVL